MLVTLSHILITTGTIPVGYIIIHVDYDRNYSCWLHYHTCRLRPELFLLVTLSYMSITTGTIPVSDIIIHVNYDRNYSCWLHYHTC